ncbi:MAG: InlB B-repeat-containing protein, partial [Peptococcaceae bacterium]|nr:InlB B-repeat-containing protein [Peptococcaceae bacterium]
PNAFTRTGYTFLGWLANDADNTRYADEATIENIVQDIELTARWRANVGDDSSEPPANPSAPNEIVLPLAGGDDAYTEFDDEGNPLGEWHWDESIQEWVFEPYQPLDDLPKTGGSGILLGSLLAAFSAGALALRFAAGKKRGLHPKQ